MKFQIEPTELPGVLLLAPRVYEDARGFFLETFHKAWFLQHDLPTDFVQDNHSHSKHGTLRGLHFQTQQPQGKLVRCVAGAIFDVAVDLRPNSPAFGRWHGVTLSAANRRQLWIPPGLAHGFCTLSDFADVSYRCTDYYAPAHEETLLWNDPEIGVDWPIDDPRLSEKDRCGKRWSELDLAPPAVSLISLK